MPQRAWPGLSIFVHTLHHLEAAMGSWPADQNWRCVSVAATITFASVTTGRDLQSVKSGSGENMQARQRTGATDPVCWHCQTQTKHSQALCRVSCCQCGQSRTNSRSKSAWRGTRKPSSAHALARRRPKRGVVRQPVRLPRPHRFTLRASHKHDTHEPHTMLPSGGCLKTHLFAHIAARLVPCSPSALLAGAAPGRPWSGTCLNASGQPSCSLDGQRWTEAAHRKARYHQIGRQRVQTAGLVSELCVKATKKH